MMNKESGRNTYKIYVGNLSFNTTDADLFRVFANYGTVIESVALAGKGFGFVHMASEEDGVRAMKSLYKYVLNRKEMVVQPAINPKKASVNQYSSRRATIGKRVSTLDYFEDYIMFDSNFLEQEMANHLSESPPAEKSSSSNYTSFTPSSTVSSQHPSRVVPQSGAAASTTETPVSSGGGGGSNLSLISSNLTAAGVRTDTGGIINGVPQQQQQHYNAVPGNGVTVNSGGHQSPLLVLGQTLHGNPATAVVAASQRHQLWGGQTAPPPLNTVVQFANTLPHNSSSHLNNTPTSMHTFRSGPNVNPLLTTSDHLLNNQGNVQVKNVVLNQANNIAALNHNMNTIINPLINGLPPHYQQQLSAVQLALAQNPSNTQLIETYNKLLQEIFNSVLVQNPQLIRNKEIENNLKLKLLQQQEQLRLQQLMNNGASGITTSQFSANNGINVNSTCNSSGALGVVTLTSIEAPHNGNTTTSTTTASNGDGVKRCSVCQEAYNTTSRLPKILGCTHTFCLQCLHMHILSMNTPGDLQCLSGCGVATHLSSAGVAGLTTNQGIIASGAQFNGSTSGDGETALQANSSSTNGAPGVTNSNNSEEVCASCTGGAEERPVSVCREEGHTLVATKDAMNLIVAQLRPLVEASLTTLREAMAMRANMKERVQSTIHSLAKFMDELKKKVSRESTEEDLLLATLNDLNSVHQQLHCHGYQHLIRTYHMVDRCAKDITAQHTQCLTATHINEAVEAMILHLHDSSVSDMSKLGLKQHEMFSMDHTLQEHARHGNYANVLLQYMVADLLASRLSTGGVPPAAPAPATPVAAVSGKDVTPTVADGQLNQLVQANSVDNLSLQESRSASSISPPIASGADSLNFHGSNGDSGVGNSVFRSLTASSSATPDMNAMNSVNDHEIDHVSNNLDSMDLNYVIQTTEAIESETMSNSQAELASYSDNSTLGLSNISRLAANEETVEMKVDLEKSLLEGSACMEPPTNNPVVQSSAPSPRSNSSTSITPPIVGGAAAGATRSSVDSSAASSDSGILTFKPFSYVDAAKKPAKLQEVAPKSAELLKISSHIKQTRTPHCWMKLSVDGKSIGRIVFQLRPDKAPKMCENFLGLCTGKAGYGYRGTHFFKNGDGFLAGGDVEFDDGSGGYSIFGKKKFEADLCPLKDEVGMIRFKGNGTSETGKGMVGSQFMVWYAEREFKKFSYSLVFGRVVDGLDVVKKAANVNLLKHDVMIEESGGVL